MTQLMLVAIFLAANPSAAADFAGDFQAAKKLLEQEDYQTAHQAFTELAASAPNAHGKAWSLSYAARALARQNQYDQAIRLAKTIGAKPLSAYTQMVVMDVSRKPRELVAAFRDEDLGAWPDQINYKGFLLRGKAHHATKDPQAALKDFEQCAELAGSDAGVKLEALNQVAAHSHVLKDDARSLDVYRKVLAAFDETPNRKGLWLYPQTLLGAARVLMGQEKYAEANAILAKFADWPHKETRGPWDFLIIEAHGDLALAEGRRDDALARYEDAVTIKTHKGYIDRVTKKIEALKGEEEKQPE